MGVVRPGGGYHSWNPVYTTVGFPKGIGMKSIRIIWNLSESVGKSGNHVESLGICVRYKLEW